MGGCLREKVTTRNTKVLSPGWPWTWVWRRHFMSHQVPWIDLLPLLPAFLRSSESRHPRSVDVLVLSISIQGVFYDSFKHSSHTWLCIRIHEKWTGRGGGPKPTLVGFWCSRLGAGLWHLGTQHISNILTEHCDSAPHPISAPLFWELCFRVGQHPCIVLWRMPAH